MDQFQTQIIFEYYKQQREEANQLARERSSVSLQILVIAGALAAASFQFTALLPKLGLSVAIVILGIVGIIHIYNYEMSITTHMARARAARKSVAFLDPFASSASKFGKLQTTYYLLPVFIIGIGVLLFVAALV